MGLGSLLGGVSLRRFWPLNGTEGGRSLACASLPVPDWLSSEHSLEAGQGPHSPRLLAQQLQPLGLSYRRAELLWTSCLAPLSLDFLPSPSQRWPIKVTNSLYLVISHICTKAVPPELPQLAFQD